MSTAEAGRRVEWLVRDDLLSYAWAIAARAAGSKGAADLIAFRPGRVAVVQVKKSDPQLEPVERARLIALADWLGLDIALPIVAAKPLRRPIVYRQLTGPGPKDWRPWHPLREEAA